MNTTLSTATTSLDTAGVDTDRTDTPEPRRRSRWARRGLAATAALAVFAAGGVASAAMSFDDVPESHPFYDEIEWMAETGISTGYDDGTFRPGDPVTRQAMSAFMQRLYNLQDRTYFTVNSTARTIDGTAWTQPSSTAVTNIEVPEGTRGWLNATFTAETSCYAGNGYCRARLMYGPMDSDEAWEMLPTVGTEFAFDSTQGGDGSLSAYESHTLTRSTLAPLLPGNYRVWLEVSASSGDGTTLRLDDSHFQVEVDLAPTDL
jgi:hypothetical protein